MKPFDFLERPLRAIIRLVLAASLVGLFFTAFASPAFATSGPDDLQTELQDFVKGRLTPHKYPRWVTVVNSLPKTATGKTQRFVLRETMTEV